MMYSNQVIAIGVVGVQTIICRSEFERLRSTVLNGLWASEIGSGWLSLSSVLYKRDDYLEYIQY